MKYVYVVWCYKPKHKYNGFIYEGSYDYANPKIFTKNKDAKAFRKKYIHASYMKRLKLR